MVYAGRKRQEDRKKIWMHREIMRAGIGVRVDHKEHKEDELFVDNRKENLRVATAQQNQNNKRKERGCSSPFKGVSLIKGTDRWEAYISHCGHRIHLGRFRVEAHAAYVYDLTAVKLFGEFALTNFPVPGSTSWLYGEAS